MATSFCDIYKMVNKLGDFDLSPNLTTNQYYQIMADYMEFAIAEFQSSCSKVKTYTPFQQVEFYIEGNGIDNEIELDNYLMNSKLLVNYRETSEDSYTEIKEYAFDDISLRLTLDFVPIVGSELYIVSYVIGEFEADLDLQEKQILAYGMKVPYLYSKIAKSNLLNQMVFNGSSSKFFSQANHLDALNGVYDTAYYKTLKSKINEYSFCVGLSGEV